MVKTRSSNKRPVRASRRTLKPTPKQKAWQQEQEAKQTPRKPTPRKQTPSSKDKTPASSSSKKKRSLESKQSSQRPKRIRFRLPTQSTKRTGPGSEPNPKHQRSSSPVHDNHAPPDIQLPPAPEDLQLPANEECEPQDDGRIEVSNSDQSQILPTQDDDLHEDQDSDHVCPAEDAAEAHVKNIQVPPANTKDFDDSHILPTQQDEPPTQQDQVPPVEGAKDATALHMGDVQMPPADTTHSNQPTQNSSEEIASMQQQTSPNSAAAASTTHGDEKDDYQVLAKRLEDLNKMIEAEELKEKSTKISETAKAPSALSSKDNEKMAAHEAAVVQTPVGLPPTNNSDDTLEEEEEASSNVRFIFHSPINSIVQDDTFCCAGEHCQKNGRPLTNHRCIGCGLACHPKCSATLHPTRDDNWSEPLCFGCVKQWNIKTLIDPEDESKLLVERFDPLVVRAKDAGEEKINTLLTMTPHLDFQQLFTYLSDKAEQRDDADGNVMDSGNGRQQVSPNSSNVYLPAMTCKETAVDAVKDHLHPRALGFDNDNDDDQFPYQDDSDDDDNESNFDNGNDDNIPPLENDGDASGTNEAPATNEDDEFDLTGIGFYNESGNTIYQDESRCCAGQLCMVPDIPLNTHSRCASCLCCVHGDCAFEVEETTTQIPQSFARVCTMCVKKQLMPIRVQDKNHARMWLSGEDKGVEANCRILKQPEPPIIRLVAKQDVQGHGLNAIPIGQLVSIKKKKSKKKAAGDLNLRCIESMRQHYPKGYSGRKGLQPIIPYRVSLEAFNQWVNMTREEQEVAKEKFYSLSKRKRNEIELHIPGAIDPHCDCSGCNKKVRKDKGQPKKRRSSHGRASMGDGPGVPYASMGHDKEARVNLAAVAGNKKAATRRKAGRRNQEIPTCPKTIQQQYDAIAMGQINSAMVQMQRALTASYMPSTDSNQARVRGYMVWEIEVEEPPMNGGPLAKHELRRSKPLAIRMSTSKEDMAHLMNMVTDASWKENRVVKDFFGFGQEGMDRVNQYINDQKEARSKSVGTARSVADALEAAGFDDIVTTQPIGQDPGTI